MHGGQADVISRERWGAPWRELGLATPAPVFDELLARYSEPHRHYHNLTHIADCLAHFDHARELCEHAAEVELALWFHDAIYDTHAKDNEAQSAAWAVRVLSDAGTAQAVRERVHALIMATCHTAAPDTPDACTLVDIDLSILGAVPGRFDAYENEIRAEYAWVPGFLFRATRRKILREFLARPSIYSTGKFKQSLESNARANLARSLQSRKR